MITFLLLQMGSGQPDRTDLSLILFGCVILTALMVFYIFSGVETESPEIKTRLGYLYERKDQVYENLRDLNFEYKAGKLSDDDFTTMRDSMEQEATSVLAEIEQLERARGAASARQG